MLRSTTSRLTTLLVACAAGLGLVAAPLVASAAPVTRVDLCHYDADLNVYKLIKVAPISVNDHLRNHPDAYPGDWVPLQRGYTFDSTCGLVSHLVTINFDDLSLSGEQELGAYAGFTWIKGWAFSPANSPALGYGVASPPNIGFIGFPQDNNPMVINRGAQPDVSFVSVFVTNPTATATDPDGPITVSIKAFDDSASAGEVQVVLADGASQTVTLPFDSVDKLELSAGGKYFGIDDLTYFVSPS